MANRVMYVWKLYIGDHVFETKTKNYHTAISRMLLEAVRKGYNCRLGHPMTFTVIKYKKCYYDRKELIKDVKYYTEEKHGR